MNTNSYFLNRIFSRTKVDNEGRQLPKVLNLFNLIFLGVSGTIGAGVYSVIGYAAQYAGPSIMITFAITGVLCFLTCFPYAEFSAKIHSAGFAYSYVYCTCGELIAFLTGIFYSVNYLGASAVSARCWSSYVTSYLALLGFNIPDWLNVIKINDVEVSFLGCIIVTIFSLLMLWGMKESTTINNVVCILNLTTILFVIIAGSFYINFEQYTPFFPNGIKGAFAGTGLAFFTYLGFEGTACFTEETNNPEKNLPIALIIVLLMAILANGGIAVVLTGMVSLETMNVDQSVLAAFQKVAPGWMSTVIGIGSILGLTTSLSGCLLCQPRIFYGIATDGLLPKVYKKLKNGVLEGSILLTGLICIIFTILFKVDLMGNVVSLGGLLASALVDLAVVIARYEIGGKPNIKVNYCCATFFMASFFFSVSIFYDWPMLLSIGMMALLIGSYVFIMLQEQTNTPKTFKCPWVPFIPLAGTFTLLVMASTVDLNAWATFIVCCIFGIAYYFYYGYHHSKLNPLNIESAERKSMIYMKEESTM